MTPVNVPFPACSFAPSLTVMCYSGDKQRRAELQKKTASRNFSVVLTTYEVSGSRENKATQSFF